MVLLTGGTGFVGSHTAHNLIDRGFRIRCLVRPTSDLTRLPAGVETVQGHLLNFESLRKAAQKCWGVIHVGGVVKVRQVRDFYLVNRDGTANLLKAAREEGVEKFLYCSSQAAAGPSNDTKPRTAEDLPRPVTEYGKSKLAGEEILKSKAGKMWWCIIRPPAVYGPLDVAFLPLIKSINRGFKLRIGKGTKFSIVHVTDLANAIVTVLEKEHASGKTWFVTDGDIHDEEDLAEAIETALGVRAYRITVPVWIARSLGSMNEFLSRIHGTASYFNREKVSELTQPVYTCDDTSFREEFRFQNRYDLKSGMIQTVRWYRDKKWL